MLTTDLLKSITEYIDDNYVDLNEPSINKCADLDEVCAFKSVPSMKEMVGIEEVEEETDDEIEICSKCSDSFDDADYFYSAKGFSPLTDEDLNSVLDESFKDMLFRLIDERDLKDSFVYIKAGLTRQHFNKIKNVKEYKPSKKTVIALALSLELSLKEIDELLLKAGFALSNSSKFDLIIKYCIEHRIYDVIQVNQILYSFDQELL